MRGKKSMCVLQTTFVIDLGICLQLTSSESEENFKYTYISKEHQILVLIGYFRSSVTTFKRPKK